MTQETLCSLPVSERYREVPVYVRMQAGGFCSPGLPSRGLLPLAPRCFSGSLWKAKQVTDHHMSPSQLSLNSAGGKDKFSESFSTLISPWSRCYTPGKVKSISCRDGDSGGDPGMTAECHMTVCDC